MTVAARSADVHFGVEHLVADLKGHSVRGGVVTLSAQGIKFLLQVGSTAVLARLLTPADFGLVAMAAAFIGFVGLFRDLGLSVATVQRISITHAQVSTLFWINVALSLVLTVFAAALAPAVAWFYGEPKLSLIVVAAAATFILGGLTCQHSALLRRQMRFGRLAGIDVLSMGGAIATGVVLAWAGAGYWSLVAMGAVSAAIEMILCWSSSGWRPGAPRRDSGIGPMVGLGANHAGSGFFQYISRNLDNVLIGWWCGPGALGFYAKAYSLLMMPINQVNGPVSAVALPALCRLQGDPARYRRFYRKSVSMMVFFGMPLVAFAFVAADKVVLLLLGNQWSESVPLFRALAPAAFVGTFNVATGWVFVSMGQTNRQLRLAIFNTLIIVAAMFLGLRYGAYGVAVAYSIAMVTLRLPHVIYCFWPTPLRLMDLVSALATPFAASLGAAAGLFVLDHFVTLQQRSLTLSVAFDALIYLALYGLILLTIPSGRRLLRNLSDVLRELRTPLNAS